MPYYSGIELKDLQWTFSFKTFMRRTPTSQSPAVARTCMSARSSADRGDGPAEEHLVTGTEAVNRRMARRLGDIYCSPGPG
eukprot:1242532-Prymnesium_polylepis.1